MSSQDYFAENGSDLNCNAREFVPHSMPTVSSSSHSPPKHIASPPKYEGRFIYSSPPSTTINRSVDMDAPLPPAPPRVHHSHHLQPAPRTPRVQQMPEHAAYMPVSRTILPLSSVYKDPHQLYVKHQRAQSTDGDKHYRHIHATPVSYRRPTQVVDSREHFHLYKSRGNSNSIRYVLCPRQPTDPADFIRSHYAKMGSHPQVRTQQWQHTSSAQRTDQQQWIYIH